MQFDITQRAKPVVKWAGGKSSLLQQLIPLFPSNFSNYIEPFLGGGAVFLSLNPAKNAILGEFNPEIYNLYCVVRDNCDELMQQLDAFEQHYSKQFYYDLRGMESGNVVMRAARTLFLNKTGFNGLYRQNSRGQFNVPFGHRLKCPALYSSDNLAAVARRLKNAQLCNQDFAAVIAQASEGDLVYCDPPYEPLSKTSSFNSYTQSGFSQSEQTRLRDACEQAVARGASVAVSNSAAAFILELYDRWPIHRLKARRAINSNASSRGAIDEILVVMNPSHRA